MKVSSRNVQGVNGDGEELSSMYVYAIEDHRLHFGDEKSLTRSEFAEECDINVLMSRYEKTGDVSAFMNNVKTPQYLDLSVVPDFQTALHVLRDAQLAFDALPAQVRFEFNNSPEEFVAFASDPENLSQMRTWGLAPPEKLPDAPMRVEVVNPPAEPAA